MKEITKRDILVALIKMKGKLEEDLKALRITISIFQSELEQHEQAEKHDFTDNSIANIDNQ